MNKQYLDFLSSELEKLREQGLYKTERVMASPQGAVGAGGRPQGHQPLRQQLPGPGQPPGAGAGGPGGLDRHGFGMSSVRFICGTQDIHKELEAQLSALPGHGGRPALLQLLRRQRRRVRGAPGRGGRHHLRRPEPRLHHRRHPPVQGQALPLRQQRHGASWRRGCRRPSRRRPVQAGGHRRRVQHGRLPGQPAGHLRPGRAPRRHGDGGRQPRGGLHRRARAGAPTSTTGSWAGWTSSPAPWARRWAAPRAATSPPAAGGGMLRQRSRPYLFSNTPGPGHRRRQPQGAGHAARTATACASSCAPTPRSSAPAWSELGFKLLPGRAPDHPGDALRRAAGPGLRRGAAGRGVYVTGFFFPVVPKGQARIRTQMSAAHSAADIDAAIAAFAKVGRALGVIK